jgi:CDP-diacylglycerol--serine O-phosphatidyltransferase
MASFNRRKNKNKLTLISKVPRANKLSSRSPSVEESEHTGALPARRRGIYLLPNAFTTAALFCGFYAIVMAMNLKFEYASIAIFAAMVLDGIDGRVARLTNTQSEFGAQYDSLSDMVSFGAAPSLVIYEWSLRGLGKLGWLAAFVYCAGAALRLARFNTNIGVVDKRYFQGLPSPAAAALVAGTVWLLDDLHFVGTDLSWLAWIVTVYAGLTMVTNVPFYSFKDVNFRKSVPFIAVFLIVLAFVAISSDPPKVLFGLFVCYGLSGYGVYFWRLFKGRPVSIIETEEDPVDERD